MQTAMLTAAFHIDNGAFTKLSVAYALAELVAAVVLGVPSMMADRAATVAPGRTSSTSSGSS